MAQAVKNLPEIQETQKTLVQPLDWKDALEKEMTTYSSILAWKIPWTEEPGGLQSKGLQSQTQLSNWANTSQLLQEVLYDSTGKEMWLREVNKYLKSHSY